MKKANLLYFLALLIILTSVIYSCQKEFNNNTSEIDAGIEPNDITIIKKAKIWVAENKSYSTKGLQNELNVNDLTFEWSNYDLGTNLAGQEILTVPIKSNVTQPGGYIELGLVVDIEGNANGMIKEYLGNPYVGEMTLNLYTGTGRLFETGWYRADTKEMQTKKVTGIHKAKASRTRATMGGYT